MKKLRIRFVVVCLTALSLFTMTIGAFTRASDYIYDYSIFVYTSGSKIYTDFSIDASSNMTKIGASSIKIYEYPYGNQDLVSSKTESSTGMAASNTSFYSNTIAYTGKSDTKYKVVVTVFARDASGSDSRTETHYVST